MITTDIPLHLESRNMLTGIDQTSMFSGITKEAFTLTNPDQIPHVIRRAFRVATTGKCGPVHIRIPYDLLQADTEYSDIYDQKDFIYYPGHRPIAQIEKIIQALKVLGQATRPVIVCGQGTLYSQAWEEVTQIAELFAIPVGTTINGKGTIQEHHPLSLGVVGARGGTSLSNRIVQEADVVFFIGSSTDSAGTDAWSIPNIETKAKIIQLDISEKELGNNYRTEVILLGDVKSTLKSMLELSEKKPSEFNKLPRIKSLREGKLKQLDYIQSLSSSNESPIHPVRFMKELQEALPDERCLVMDVGTSAIYTSTFYMVPEAGRTLAFNFAMGSLGYALPASIGANIACPENCTVALVGDGSFGLTAAELETVARIGLNNNIIVVNNRSFGWIRAEWRLIYGDEYVDFATNFQDVDYMKIAEGFGLKADRITKPSDLGPILLNAFQDPMPRFIELVTQPEDKLVPPVPKWIREAKQKGIRHIA
jgi:acetolactate synthase-1/2/3 large subunit